MSRTMTAIARIVSQMTGLGATRRRSGAPELVRLETGWYLPEVLAHHNGPARRDPIAPDFDDVLAEVSTDIEDLSALIASGATAHIDIADAPKWTEPLTAFYAERQSK